MSHRLGRFGAVLLLPLAIALGGCAETVVGDGQIAEGASPTPEPTESSDDYTDDFDDFSDDYTDDYYTDDTDDSDSDVQPADVDAGDTWLYTDNFEIAITAVQSYDGANAIILSDEYAVKLSLQMHNGSSVPVDVSSFYFTGDCEGGGTVDDSIDTSLSDPEGMIGPGQTANFEQGVAIDLVAAHSRCSLEITPGYSYAPAKFVFTAP